MKKLEYAGKTFFYKIEIYDCGEYGIFNCATTTFYKYVGPASKKKFWLFGPDVTYDKYEELFTFQFSIESCGVTKEKVRKKLDKKILLMGRCEEIKKGEIV